MPASAIASSTLSSTPLFAGLAPATLDALAASAEEVALADGEDAFPEGAPDGVMVVVEGSVDAVEEGGMALRWIGPGEAFDRQLTLAGVARRVLVRAAGAARLLRIPCEVTERLEQGDPAFHAAMDRMHARQLLCRLASVLGTIDGRLMDELEKAADWVYLNRGAALFEQGDAPDGLYFVVSGRLLIERQEKDGSVRTIGEAGRGQSLGEMAFFTGAPRTARACAIRDSVLVQFTNAEFDALVAARPQVMRNVARGLVERLNRLNAGGVTSHVTNLAVMAASPGAPVAAFCERLAAELSKLGPALRLSAAAADGYLGQPGIAQAPEETPDAARLLAWIEAREGSHRFVILEADPEATPWTRRCLDQADRVL
ncbi:MAG TPA: cyclic nucleotide-binding domain-containing protein, partial [Longimicrobiaceae bacterium]|nr:cyclic nucleotide-binding domain-containing protein [Longimicrobiaceae bacterium]